MMTFGGRKFVGKVTRAMKAGAKHYFGFGASKAKTKNVFMAVQQGGVPKWKVALGTAVLTGRLAGNLALSPLTNAKGSWKHARHTYHGLQQVERDLDGELKRLGMSAEGRKAVVRALANPSAGGQAGIVLSPADMAILNKAIEETWVAHYDPTTEGSDAVLGAVNFGPLDGLPEDDSNQL